METTEALRARNRLAVDALLAKFNRVATLRSLRCPEDCELRPEREAIALSCLKLIHTGLPKFVCAHGPLHYSAWLKWIPEWFISWKSDPTYGLCLGAWKNLYSDDLERPQKRKKGECV